MQRESPKREIVASTPYRPPAAASTRKGGRRLRWSYVLSAGALVGVTVLAGVAVIDSSSPPRVDVGFSTPSAPVRAPVTAAEAPPPAARLVVERRGLHLRLVSEGKVVWRGRGPVGCLSGKRLRRLGSASRLVARGCVRLRSGAVVTLAARVPAGTRVQLRR
jgi:hypothetical protein